MQTVQIKNKLADLWCVLLLAAVVMMLATVAARACVSLEEDPTPGALYQAAANNDTQALQELIDSKANLNARTLYMPHAIHTAAFMGHTDIVNMFVDNGVPVDTQDPNGLTALHWAARNGRADVVRTLIAHGADVNALSRGSTSLLCNGVWGARDVEFTLGQQAVAAVNCKAKQSASFEEQYKQVRSDYIYKSAKTCARDIYVANMVLGPDDIQFTFAQGLETLNEPEVAKKLAAEGFDLDEIWQGYCPLYSSISTGEAWAVDKHIKHVLYRDAANKNDYTPLRWAQGNGHADIAKLLLDAGAQSEPGTGVVTD